MRCGNPAVEVRAAAAVLEMSMRAVEQFDLAERIATLEQGQRPRLAAV
jgi:hypothetical protein